jgi:hypothetical protein
MATPGQLVQTMAEALGIPAETVTNYDRVLSENGMRSKSGRGRGSAKVTAADAANLLIAIMGSPIAGASVKEAANTCRTYGSLPVVGFALGTVNFAKVGLKMLDDMPKKHTLRDGITALIDSATRGGHLKRGARRYQYDRLCSVRLAGPRPWAGIYVEGDGKEFARRTYFNYPIIRGSDKEDLRQDRYITYRTIRILGSLLSEPADKFRGTQ